MYLWRRSHNDIRWRCKMNLSGHVKEDCRFASKLEQQRRKNGIVKTAGSCLKMAENAASRYLISSCQAKELKLTSFEIKRADKVTRSMAWRLAVATSLEPVEISSLVSPMNGHCSCRPCRPSPAS